MKVKINLLTLNRNYHYLLDVESEDEVTSFVSGLVEKKRNQETVAIGNYFVDLSKVESIGPELIQEQINEEALSQI